MAPGTCKYWRRSSKALLPQGYGRRALHWQVETEKGVKKFFCLLCPDALIFSPKAKKSALRAEFLLLETQKNEKIFVGNFAIFSCSTFHVCRQKMKIFKILEKATSSARIQQRHVFCNGTYTMSFFLVYFYGKRQKLFNFEILS